MKLTNEQLVALVKSAQCADNYQDYWKDINKNRVFEETLLNTLLQGKILVDRWGNVTEMMVFNLEDKELVDKALKNWASSHSDPDKDRYYDGHHIWGADIEYSDVIPKNQVLFLSNLHRLDEILNPDFYTSNPDASIDNGHAIAILQLPNKR